VLRDASEVLPSPENILKSETDPSAASAARARTLFRTSSATAVARSRRHLGGHGCHLSAAIRFQGTLCFSCASDRSHRQPDQGAANVRIDAADHSSMPIAWRTRTSPGSRSTRSLCNYAQLLQLTPYIKKDIVNEGSLADTIVGFAGSQYRPPPPQWYGHSLG